MKFKVAVHAVRNLVYMYNQLLCAIQRRNFSPISNWSVCTRLRVSDWSFIPRREDLNYIYAIRGLFHSSIKVDLVVSVKCIRVVNIVIFSTIDKMCLLTKSLIARCILKASLA